MKKLASWIATGLLAFVLWSQSLYVTNEGVQLAWDRVTPGTAYEIYEVVAVWEGVNGAKQEFPIGRTLSTSVLVNRLRSGVFFFKVRAEDKDGNQSEWAVSTDPKYATVNGQPGGWRVLFELPPVPGGGVH